MLKAIKHGKGAFALLIFYYKGSKTFAEQPVESQTIKQASANQGEEKWQFLKKFPRQ